MLSCITPIPQVTADEEMSVMQRRLGWDSVEVRERDALHSRTGKWRTHDPCERASCPVLRFRGTPPWGSGDVVNRPPRHGLSFHCKIRLTGHAGKPGTISTRPGGSRDGGAMSSEQIPRKKPTLMRNKLHRQRFGDLTFVSRSRRNEGCYSSGV